MVHERVGLHQPDHDGEVPPEANGDGAGLTRERPRERNGDPRVCRLDHILQRVPQGEVHLRLGVLHRQVRDVPEHGRGLRPGVVGRDPEEARLVLRVDARFCGREQQPGRSGLVDRARDHLPVRVLLGDVVPDAPLGEQGSDDVRERLVLHPGRLIDHNEAVGEILLAEHHRLRGHTRDRVKRALGEESKHGLRGVGLPGRAGSLHNRGDRPFQDAGDERKVDEPRGGLLAGHQLPRVPAEFVKDASAREQVRAPLARGLRACRPLLVQLVRESRRSIERRLPRRRERGGVLAVECARILHPVEPHELHPVGERRARGLPDQRRPGLVLDHEMDGPDPVEMRRKVGDVIVRAGHTDGGLAA